MKHPENAHEEIKVVGKSGQISLGKNYAGKTLRVERFGDGRIVLTSVAVIPESQLWTLSEPDKSSIQRGIEWARSTKPEESNLDALMKQRSAKPKLRSRARG